jgi:toxin ParE1/3/4
MPRCRFLPEAAADLEAIGDYIAADSPRRAVSFVATLEAVCRRLAESPGMGVARDRLRPGLRMFPTRGHLIFYAPTDDGIEVVRVLSGRRNVDALF